MRTNALPRHWCAAAAVAVVLCACAGPKEDEVPPSITPPKCTDVKRFGNAATCSVQDPKLAACGTLPSRTCASAWLCFDAPEYADCACESDADCDPRTTYINDARVAAGKAPLASKCLMGRCGGRP